MESLVFSKNRPAQLELYIRSHKRFWGEPMRVLYKADREYEPGYEKVMNMYPDVVFEKETNFRKQVIGNLRGEYTVYFCDDDVMIRPFSEKMREFKKFASSPDILCLSLRMARNYDYCFDSDQKVEIPKFKNGVWEWYKYPLDWGYPMSVLGNIFRTEDIKPLIERLNFSSPNTFEGQMAANPLPMLYMIGFKHARNINLPQNLVQTEAMDNRAGDTSIKELNDKFMDGYIIDLNDVIKKTKKARSCFTIINFKWRKL